MFVINDCNFLWPPNLRASQGSVNKNIKPKLVRRQSHQNFIYIPTSENSRAFLNINDIEMARNDSQSVKQSVLCYQSVSYVVIITHYCCTQLTLLTHHYRQYLYSDTAQHSLQSTKSYNPFPQTNTLFTDSKTNISIYF